MVVVYDGFALGLGTGAALCFAASSWLAASLDDAGRPVSRVVEARPAVGRLLLLVYRGECELGAALLHLHVASIKRLIRGLIRERRWHAGCWLLRLALVVQVGEVRWLAAATSRASRVPVEAALITAMEGTSGTNGRVRAALAVLLMLQRRALCLRDVRAQLRRYVPLVHACLLCVNVSLILLHYLTWSLNVAGAGRYYVGRLLEAIRHELVVLRFTVHLGIEGPQVALAHSRWLLLRHSLHFVCVVGQVLGTKALVWVRVPWLRVLSVEVAWHSTSLSRMLRLTVRMLFLVSFTEHGVVPYPVHLGLVLLPEVEGVRLEVVVVSRHLPLHILLMLHGLGIAANFSNHALFLHWRRLRLPLVRLLWRICRATTIELPLQALDGLGMVDLGNIRRLLILDINLIQNHLLLSELRLLRMKLMVRRLALLARPIDAYVSRHSVMGLVVGILLRIDTILLRNMRLVRRATHVIANQIGAVVYQFLFPLRLYAVVAWTLPSLMRIRLIRFVRRNAFLVTFGESGSLLSCALVARQQLLILLKLQLVRLLYHGLLPLVDAAARFLVLLLRLRGSLRLTLIFENDAGVDVVLVDAGCRGGHSLRLILLPEVVAEVRAAAVSLRVLAVLAQLCALHLLVVDLYLLLVLISLELGVITVVLLLRLRLLRRRQAALHAVVRKLRLDQVHLWAKLCCLAELRVAVR